MTPERDARQEPAKCLKQGARSEGLFDRIARTSVYPRLQE